MNKALGWSDAWKYKATSAPKEPKPLFCNPGVYNKNNHGIIHNIRKVININDGLGKRKRIT